MSSKWNRVEVKSGYVSYTNKETGEEISMDPNLTQIIRKFNSFRGEKFIQYVGKLHFLRIFLRTIDIPYNLVLSIMDRHQFLSTDDAPLIKAKQLLSLFYDVFYAANKLKFLRKPNAVIDSEAVDEADDEFNADDQATILCTLLWNVFDPNRNKPISTLELKYALLLLGSCNSIEEFMQHQLHLSIDHNRCITQTRFRSMTSILLKLLHSIDNDIKLDTNTVSGIVQRAFANATGLAGLNDVQFYAMWHTNSRKDPMEYEYYLNLIQMSYRWDSKVLHKGIECAGRDCDHKFIEGVRLSCSKCTRYNLCLLCYLTTSVKAGKHNPETHKMIEIENQVTKKRSHSMINQLLKILFFVRTKRDYNSSDRKTEQDIEMTADKDLTKINLTSRDQLLSIIEMLSTENRLFQSNLERIQKTNATDTKLSAYLERHKNILSEQIEQLRSLYGRNTLNNASPFPAAVGPTQKFHSTPFRPNLTKIHWDLNSLGPNNSHTEVVESRMIRGEEINRTYFEANRSDRTLQDVSTWWHLRESFCRDMNSFQENLENAMYNASSPVDQEMHSFRGLLRKVCDMLEDTYSDNTQLSTVTQQLELIVDRIIGDEEKRRASVSK